MKLERYPGNPILQPLNNDWESMQVRNPAAWFDGTTVPMIYTARSVWNTIYLGYATSQDGFHFTRMSDRPWLEPSQDGFDAGTVEDARIVRIDGTYYVTYMARATGNLTLKANAVVERLEHDPVSGRISRVHVIDAQSGERLAYSARLFFLCASTVGSTQILMNSTSASFPNGLANSSGVLGRYLMDHTLGTSGMGIFLDNSSLLEHTNMNVSRKAKFHCGIPITMEAYHSSLILRRQFFYPPRLITIALSEISTNFSYIRFSLTE